MNLLLIVMDRLKELSADSEIRKLAGQRENVLRAFEAEYNLGLYDVLTERARKMFLL